MAMMEDALRFTIDAGIVTAVYEYDDGIWKRQGPDPEETYRVDPVNSNVVIKTEVKNGVAEIDRYETSDGGLTYYKVDSEEDGDGGDSGDGDLYRFQFETVNRIVAVSKFDDGVWKPLRLDGNEVFAVDPVLGRARVIMTENDHGEGKTEIYEDPDGNGDYVEVGSVENQDDDVYFGSALADVARGGLGSDDLYGEDGDDDLYGDAGDDDLFGDKGDDDLYGGVANDELYGGIGNDHLNGETGDDDLTGNDGNDDLDGGDGSDDLYAGAGSDRLVGGRGLDRLSGGLAADVFLFASKLDSPAGLQRDVIVDFSASQKDRLNLAAIDANELRAGNQAFSWLGSRSFSGVAGQLRYVTVPSGGGLFLQADVNGDRNADVEISLLAINALASAQIVL